MILLVARDEDPADAVGAVLERPDERRTVARVVRAGRLDLSVHVLREPGDRALVRRGVNGDVEVHLVTAEADTEVAREGEIQGRLRDAPLERIAPGHVLRRVERVVDPRTEREHAVVLARLELDHRVIRGNVGAGVAPARTARVAAGAGVTTGTARTTAATRVVAAGARTTTRVVTARRRGAASRATVTRTAGAVTARTGAGRGRRGARLRVDDRVVAAADRETANQTEQNRRRVALVHSTYLRAISRTQLSSSTPKPLKSRGRMT